MSKGRGADKRGRSKKGPPFVQLFHYMIDSPAWRSLLPVERAAYVEIASKFDGKNNGKILMSARMLAPALGISKATAAAALNMLVKSELVEVVVDCGFNMKTGERFGRKFRLTVYRCNAVIGAPIPRKEFPTTVRPLRNRQNAVQLEGQSGPATGTDAAKNHAEAA